MLAPGLKWVYFPVNQIYDLPQTVETAAVAQWAIELAPQKEGWVLESQPRHTLILKTSNNTSTA